MNRINQTDDHRVGRVRNVQKHSKHRSSSAYAKKAGKKSFNDTLKLQYKSLRHNYTTHLSSSSSRFCPSLLQSQRCSLSHQPPNLRRDRSSTPQLASSHPSDRYEDECQYERDSAHPSVNLPKRPNSQDETENPSSQSDQSMYSPSLLSIGADSALEVTSLTSNAQNISSEVLRRLTQTIVRASQLERRCIHIQLSSPLAGVDLEIQTHQRQVSCRIWSCSTAFQLELKQNTFKLKQALAKKGLNLRQFKFMP